MNFDSVASIYDRTRGFPDEVAAEITDAILRVTQATPETRFLELGIGTGRIALPFIERGYRYAGIDISEGMMALLEEKARAVGRTVELVGGDVTEMPFPDNSIDVVIVVRVLHLVPEWRQALREAARVLTGDGYLVLGGNDSSPDSSRRIITQQSRVALQEAGAPLRPAYGTRINIQEALADMGWWTAEYRVTRWMTEFRPIEMLEHLRSRTYSHTWGIPDDVLEEAHRRLLVWATERFGDLDGPIQSQEEFGMTVARPA